jgi:hypothetical protein
MCESGATADLRKFQVRKSQKDRVRKSQIRTKCHICRRAANLTHHLGPQVCVANLTHHLGPQVCGDLRNLVAERPPLKVVGYV